MPSNYQPAKIQTRLRRMAPLCDALLACDSDEERLKLLAWFAIHATELRQLNEMLGRHGADFLIEATVTLEASHEGRVGSDWQYRVAPRPALKIPVRPR